MAHTSALAINSKNRQTLAHTIAQRDKLILVRHTYTHSHKQKHIHSNKFIQATNISFFFSKEFLFIFWLNATPKTHYSGLKPKSGRKVILAKSYTQRFVILLEMDRIIY